MDKNICKKYAPGKLIECHRIKGVVIYPRKRGKISVAWQGMNEIDDYSPKWLMENCFTEEDIKDRYRFPRFP